MIRADKILEKSLKFVRITEEEANYLFEEASLSDLMFVANEIRKRKHIDNFVGWIIDRNINITNICYSACEFCNFYTNVKAKNAYITNSAEYEQKIKEMFELGGEQILLQGGLNPKLGLSYYKSLYESLKEKFPQLKIHSLGPAEIHFIARKEKLSYKEVLQELMKSGLDSLPGAGAEILVDKVRNKISPNKCNSTDWLEVMKQAHRLNMPTSATMMFGHIESRKDIIEHLIKIRNLQDEKSAENYGFITFVPWIFHSKNTKLAEKHKVRKISQREYLKTIAISRIVLDNIENIQTSWLTVGVETAQISLNAGANDMGSIMIEENVLSAAGNKNELTKEKIQEAIKEAGFKPRIRNQKYELHSY